MAPVFVPSFVVRLGPTAAEMRTRTTRRKIAQHYRAAKTPTWRTLVARENPYT